MKYFQITGKSTDEIAKQLLSGYDGKAYIIKLVKEHKNVSDKKKWFHIGPIKPSSEMQPYFRAYCSLPENESDELALQNLQRPPENSTLYKEEQQPIDNLTTDSPPKAQPTEQKQEEFASNQSYIQLQADISHLKEVVQHLYHNIPKGHSQDLTGNQIHLPYLINQGFSYEFTSQFLNSLKTEVQDTSTLKLILKEKLRLQIPIENHFRFEKGDTYLFLGSTGVGKTTTLAKIAALCYRQLLTDFQFISFDSYRLGADEQLKRFADIFEKPFQLVQNTSEMANILKKRKPDEILFLDSAGESIKQEIKIPEVLRYIKLISSPLKIFLVLSAHSKIEDLYAIQKQFEKFEITHYIITKIDETNSLGSILEFLSNQKIPTSFYADGQAVPNDIKVLSLEKFFEYI